VVDYHVEPAKAWKVIVLKPHEAHPVYWAPFVVVGEGAAR
jgi:CHAT domain-containing protein